jgi:DCN1-like protein 1/2
MCTNCFPHDSSDLDIAIAFWNLLLEGKFKHLTMWEEYLLEHHKKSISKDTWNLFLDFIRTCGEDFGEYDDNGK